MGKSIDAISTTGKAEISKRRKGYSSVDPASTTKGKERKNKQLESEDLKEDEPEQLEDEYAAVKSSKKEKKRKRKEGDIAEITATGDTEPHAADEPLKKRRKNRTEFSDPRDDAALTGQTRKALEYAFTQLNKPKKWKFSKARQNWIIRNVWSLESVPDSYFPLTVTYLSKVQGGSREKLKKVAQDYLHSKVDPCPAKPADSELNKPTEATEAAQKAKKVTFGALIDPPSKAVTDSTGPIKLNVEVVRRSRAQEILKALERHIHS